MTEQLYRTDAYLRDCTAQVLAVNDRGGIVLDRTVFYAAAGGQPGDKGALEIEGGGSCPIATTVYDADKSTIVHVPAEGGARPSPGQSVRASVDWGFRSPIMRMHTTLHLLCALVKFPVTGGQVNPDDSRLDFDIDDPSAVDKDRLTADLNALIAADHPVSERWITDAELEANPGLVRTMCGEAARGYRPGAPRADRRERFGRYATVRRHARQAHRRDRSRGRHQDREEGQAEPPHPRVVRVAGSDPRARRCVLHHGQGEGSDPMPPEGAPAMNRPEGAIVLRCNGGRRYEMGALWATFKADEAETEERYSVSERWRSSPIPTVPAPTLHEENDEIFYVLEGHPRSHRRRVGGAGACSLVRIRLASCTTSAMRPPGTLGCSTSSSPAASSARCRRSSSGLPSTADSTYIWPDRAARRGNNNKTEGGPHA